MSPRGRESLVWLVAWFVADAMVGWAEKGALCLLSKAAQIRPRGGRS